MIYILPLISFSSQSKFSKMNLYKFVIPVYVLIASFTMFQDKEKKQCQGKTKKGEQCKREKLMNKDSVYYCFQHIAQKKK